MNAVAAGFCADINHGIARAFGFGEKQILFARDAESQRVDQRILRVAWLESDFSSDRGDTKTVAVASDAPNHSVEDAAIFCRLVFRRAFAGHNLAEAQRIQHGDWPRAHGKNVAQDPAHAGGRALKRLHVARMIVRLDLERGYEVVADRSEERRVGKEWRWRGWAGEERER